MVDAGNGGVVADIANALVIVSRGFKPGGYVEQRLEEVKSEMYAFLVRYIFGFDCCGIAGAVARIKDPDEFFEAILTLIEVIFELSICKSDSTSHI